jgi:hypothetical protein
MIIIGIEEAFGLCGKLGSPYSTLYMQMLACIKFLWGGKIRYFCDSLGMFEKSADHREEFELKPYIRKNFNSPLGASPLT